MEEGDQGFGDGWDQQIGGLDPVFDSFGDVEEESPAPSAGGGPAPLLGMSAVQLANQILGPPPVNVITRRPDAKHVDAFPHVSGQLDSDIVTIDWR